MTSPDEDTVSTEDDGLLAQLRAEGILGPFDIVDWAGATDVGVRRTNNEDRWGHVGVERFAVADGVGGSVAGELAAETAVGVALDGHGSLTEGASRDLFSRANAAVRYAGEMAGTEGLGTTLVVAGLHENHVVIASIGDSRAYRLRDGELEQLTRDHTVRNELLASGLALDALSDTGIRLDALTAYLGMETSHQVPVNAGSYSIMAGDRFLLCTDGVYGQLDAGELASLAAVEPCHDAVESLIAAARNAGGRDNATAVLLEFASREESHG